MTKIISSVFRKFLVAFSIVSMFSMASIQASFARATYVALDFVSGTQPDLVMSINSKSLNLDLAKTNNIRVRFKVKDLVAIVPNQGAVRVDLYEINSGDREFVARHSLNLNAGARRNRILSIDAGFFATPSKQVEFDLRDAANNLINTYSATLNATNLVAQAENVNNVGLDNILQTATCDNSTFGACQLEAFFKNVDFIPFRSRQPASEVFKTAAGRYQVRIPYPRKFVKFFRGKRTKVKVGSFVNGSTGTTGNGVTSAFGETLDASTIRLGSNISNYGRITYDPTNDNLIFGHGNNLAVENNVYLNDSGAFGIGVVPPTANLHIKQGDTASPPLKLNAGQLTTVPQDGSIEFDGNDFYVTKNGVRTLLGAGAAGPAGPEGPQGPVGPQGPAGADGIANGGSLNGTISFLSNGLLQDAVLNGDTVIQNGSLKITLGGPQDGYVLTSDANGGATWQPVSNGSTFNNINVDNGTYTNGTTTNSNIDNGTIVNSTFKNGDVSNVTINNGSVTASDIQGGTINGATLLDNILNGTLTTLSDALIEGDIEVNGEVTATKFIGDGSMLTGISSTTVNNGSVTNSNVDNGTITNGSITSSTIDNSLLLNNSMNGTLTMLSNAEILGGVINGATLVNTNLNNLNLNGSTIDNGSITSSDIEGGTINGATLLDNILNGTLTTLSDALIEGDIEVNGEVTATKFTGDGSMLTGVNADNATTANTADFATTAGTATSATSSTTATNVDGGTIDNVTIENATLNGQITGGTINGATLVNTNVNGLNVNGSTIDDATINNGDITDSMITNSDIEGGTINGATLLDNILNGTLTTLSDALIEGDIEVNGEVTATKFTGDGSMLTGVNADNATTANTADFATTAGTATSATSSTTATNVDGGTIDNVTIENATLNGQITGGTINGATLVNTNVNGLNVNGSTIDDATINNGDITDSMITNSDIEGGTINGATLSDNILNGTLTTLSDALIEGDIEVNGEVTATKFTGDGSMLTGVNADNATTANTADFATTAGTATSATSSTTATNVDGGTIDNVTIENATLNGQLTGGTINGATLVNTNVNGLNVNGSTIDDATINNGDITDSTITDSDIEGGTINGATLLDNILNGTLTTLSDALIEGDIEVNGEVTATKFTGDGSMLTGVNADNATTANTADFATAAGTATSASTATTATNVEGGTVSQTTIRSSTSVPVTGSSTADGYRINVRNGTDFTGVVSHDFLVVDKVDGNSLNPDGGVLFTNTGSDGITETAIAIRGSGNVGIGTVDPVEKLEVNGNVQADKFIGDGSMLTGITINNGDVNGDTIQANNFALSSDTVNVTAAGGLTVTSAIMRVQGDGGDVNITADPQISPGSNDGQFLIIRGMDDSATVTFEDGDGLILDAGVQFEMGAGDILTMIYDAVDGVWIEISRSDR